VADEVRQLAQRAATSAKDIRTLIDLSRQQVSGGVAEVEDSGKQLGDLVRDIAAVSERMTHLAQAAQRQGQEAVGLGATVTTVLQATEVMVDSTQRACLQSGQVRSLGQSLLQAASRFRLP
jgi:Methyl-accepting chemotaxis protein